MRKGRFFSGKNKNILGFSIIELIVVIAIMAVLSGMLVPMFVKYLQEKRATACRANREAILNVYSKCVYGDMLELDDASIQAFLVADKSAGVYPEDLVDEVNQYLTCPSDGSYSADIIGGTTIARIQCAEHGTDEVILDFTGWKGTGKEAMADPGYTEPTIGVTPVGVTPDPSPSPSATPTVAVGKSGVWPYQYTDDGLLDERWANATSADGRKGCIPGNHVDITLPLKAHFIADRTKSEYVIVKGYPQGQNSYYRVMAEWADGPDTIDVAGWNVLVKVSRKFDMRDNPPVSFTAANNNDTDDYYEIAYGDMVTIYDENDPSKPWSRKATFIFAGLQSSLVSVGDRDAVKYIAIPNVLNPVYGQAYQGVNKAGQSAGEGDWYMVPDLYTGEN